MEDKVSDNKDYHDFYINLFDIGVNICTGFPYNSGTDGYFCFLQKTSARTGKIHDNIYHGASTTANTVLPDYSTSLKEI